MDVEILATDDDHLSTLLPALARCLGMAVEALWSGSTQLRPDLRLDAAELQHGAVLGLGRPGPRIRSAERSSALELHVVGGPDAGRTAALVQGRHVVGRGTDAVVRLTDPDVSRRHAVVVVEGGRISVADLGSTNGSRLGPVPLDRRPREWSTGAVLRCGDSALTVTGPVGGPAGLEPISGGRWRMRPRALPRSSVAETEVAFPAPPTPQPPRRLAWVAIALPAVGGALMAWLLSTPTFLFFALLSPVVALSTWLSERWTRRRTDRREDAAHAEAEAAAQARLAEAVRADLRREEADHPDVATLAAAARRRSDLLWNRQAAGADRLTVRLGAGPGDTRVVRVEPDGSRRREPAGHVPVLVDLRACGGLSVVGHRDAARDVVSGVLVQLATLYPPGMLSLALLVSPDRLADWSWVRWLPHLEPAAVCTGPLVRPDLDDAVHRWLAGLVAAHAGGAAAPPGHRTRDCLVVVVDTGLQPRTAELLSAARDLGVVVLALAESVAELAVTGAALLRLGGETGHSGLLTRDGQPERRSITVDRTAPDVAGTVARDLAALTPAATASGPPRDVRLLDLVDPPPAGPDDGPRWSRSRDRLVVTLGTTAEQPVEVDLCRLGPHALVAGTTGSGKSELLQTLVSGLALNHPPDRCSFLLVDYKGGAAFAEAADLPHTVGLVTDLDGQSTARALRSLTAELARREAVLAAHAARDIRDLPDAVVLARLVIVVDEFASLAEELPAFVPGLVAIAQRGRSLGVHLVLATQRPSGVVSPEIRANCTLRICLRTTDEAESRDVLGTPAAAHLPVDLPGRGYLRTGSAPPVEFQVARVSTGPPPEPAGRGPQVQRWTWPAGGSPASPPSAHDEAGDLVRIVADLHRWAQTTATALPHRPWQPPLPEGVGVQDLPVRFEDTSTHSPTDIRERFSIGLVDRPELQSRDALELDLARGGGWLAVGGPGSGRTTLLRTVLAEAVHRLAPDRLHVHVLAAGAGRLVAEAQQLPHTGTAVSCDDVLRTVRLVQRLTEEVAARRADPQGDPARLLLLVDGAEAVERILDEHDAGRGSAVLHRLIRDGAAVGLTCVLTADRAVPGGRLASVARQRLVLPLADRADYAVAGIPNRAVPSVRPPGRALLGEDALEVQLALPRLLPGAGSSGSRTTPGQAALRIVELPADPVLPLPRGEGEPDGSGPESVRSPLLLPIGPGGDEGAALEVDLRRTGGLLVTGPPGSGRSTALDAFARHLAAAGADILRIGVPDACSPPDASAADWLDPQDVAGAAEWLAARLSHRGVVLVDDLGTPADMTALAALAGAPGRPAVPVLAAASPAQLAGYYQGPVAALRRNRTGLLLCPGPGDADVLGVRLPRTPVPTRPGSGWLVLGGLPVRVQVARGRRGGE